MVVGINWEAAHMAGPNQDFILYRDVKNITKSADWTGDTRHPKFVTGKGYGPDYEVLVPSSSKRIKATMPASYLAGSLGVKKVFKDKDYGIHTMDPHKWGDYTTEFDPERYSTKVANR